MATGSGCDWQLPGARAGRRENRSLSRRLTIVAHQLLLQLAGCRADLHRRHSDEEWRAGERHLGDGTHTYVVFIHVCFYLWQRIGVGFNLELHFNNFKGLEYFIYRVI